MPGSNDKSPWIRRYKPAPEAPVRLVCLPHAGGSAPFYLPVARGLAPGADVLAVQYPGRLDRRAEPFVDDLHVLARQVTESLLPWLDRPVLFLGHSMGAVLAFEVCRRLEQEHGVRPAHLFASGRRAPSQRRAEALHLADDATLVAEMRGLDGTDDALLASDEIVRMILPAIRNDYRAVETYRYVDGPALSCPVTVLLGDRDPKVTRPEAEAWRQHTTGPVDLHVFPGGHFFLTAHVPAVLDLVRDRLRAATAPR